MELLEAEARDPDSKGLVQAVIDGLDAQVEQYGKLLHIFRGRAYALSRLKLQALDKQAVSDSERRAVATARSRVHTRINKSNGAMAAALGSEPGSLITLVGGSCCVSCPRVLVPSSARALKFLLTCDVSRQ